MSTFLGIKYNMWHGVIPAVLFPLVMGISVAMNGASQLTFVLTWAYSSVVLFMLQGVNEAWQLIRGDVEKEYGSWENAQANSKDDWKWFFIGYGTGLGLAAAIFIILDKM